MSQTNNKLKMRTPPVEAFEKLRRDSNNSSSRSELYRSNPSSVNSIQDLMKGMEIEPEDTFDDDEEEQIGLIHHSTLQLQKSIQRNILQEVFSFKDDGWRSTTTRRSMGSSIRRISVLFFLCSVVLFLICKEAMWNENHDNFVDIEHIQREKGFHESSYGIVDQGNEMMYMDHNFTSEKDKVEITWIHPANKLNLIGHYLHNEFTSPYASPKYSSPAVNSTDEEAKYLQKLDRARLDYGAWKFHDTFQKKRPVASFDGYPNHDAPLSSFHKDSWQNDFKYVTSFVEEGIELVKRIRRAIYDEYSLPYEEDDVQIILKGYKPDLTNTQYIAFISKSAYTSLVHKLMHSMITNDAFYLVLAGDGGAAGHGNDFFVSKTMEFQRIMEPVFDKLGMRLISRNMAMRGRGSTLLMSLAGNSIYGERDVLFLDDDDILSKNHGQAILDFFLRQALLTGNRLPIIMCRNAFTQDIIQNLAWLKDDEKLWIGEINHDSSLIPSTRDENQVQTLPHAVQYLKCTSNSTHLCQEHKFNSVCWINRTDVTPDTMQEFSTHHPKDDRYPGILMHRLEARRWSLLLLHALQTALENWHDEIIIETFPLSDEHWHVGTLYNNTRSHFLQKLQNTTNDNDTPCRTMMSFLPRLCHTPMNGATEYTPRADPYHNLRKFIRPAPNGYMPYLLNSNKQQYHGPNLAQIQQRIPEGQVDVHAVAIATSSSGSFQHHRRQISTKNMTPSHTSANKNDTGITPGQGWSLNSHPLGFCDGSIQSECNRGPSVPCLLYGHNDHNGIILGDALSGWLVFDIPEVLHHGIILARIENWKRFGNPRTEGWSSVNNGKTHDTTFFHRRRHLHFDSTLTAHPSREIKEENGSHSLPSDLRFEVAINGNITQKSLQTNDYHTPVKNVPLVVLLDDTTFSGKNVQVAIRFVNDTGRDATFGISHMYWA